MATNIKVGIEVSDNGTTKKATEAAERLKNTYDAAGKSAKSIGVGGQAGGSKTAAGAMNRATTSSELVDYNRQRSVSVGTGASARDFAKQSEGLGGLVRLYATFAANVFAVTAAFNALSNAMDTTNMIRGMEQLGASTGVALSAVSKRLVETTNGAVSLREAMEATVKASSAGIDSSSILKLGKIAQQASVALGVNAADALNRLSRGVVKLEPELLDELGIFTKIDPAVKAYAKSINKAEKDLTDFERRMAFLNAVIAEGQQKFSEIEIDTNPYTKLAATLKDVLQNTLELINKGLSPLVGFLANSPGVLTAGLTGIATVLLRQALPAITKVKEGLRAAAESAAEVASGKAGDAVEARKRVEQVNLELIEERIEKEIDAVDKAQKRIQAIDKDSINKKASVYRLLNKDIQDITDADIQRAERRAKQLAKDPTKKEEAEVSRQIIDGIKGQIRAEAEHKQAREAARADLEKDKSAFSVYAQVQRAAANAQIAATKNAIVSNAAYNASLIGIRGSWVLMTAEIKKSDLQLNILQSTVLKTRAAFAIAAGAATAFANAISKVFFFIGIATTVISLVSSLFSTKEAEKFSSEIDNLNSVTENLQKTFEKIKNPFSQESLQAQSNALIEFSKTLESSFQAAANRINAIEQSTAFSFSRTLDALFDLLPFVNTAAEGAAESLSTSIGQALQSAELKLPPGVMKKLKSDIKEALMMPGDTLETGVNTMEIQASVEALFESLQRTQTRLSDDPTFAKIAKAFEDAGIFAGNLGSRIQEVRDATKEADDAAKTLIDTYKIKDPQIDFLRKTITSLEKLSTAEKELTKAGDTSGAEQANKAVRDLLSSRGMLSEQMERTDGSLEDAWVDTETLIQGLREKIEFILEAESLKIKDAYNEFARSLIPDLGSLNVSTQLNAARAELEKIRQDFNQAKILSKGKPLTTEQTKSFQLKIDQKQGEVDILQAKERIALQDKEAKKTRDSIKNRIDSSKVQENILEAQRSINKLSEVDYETKIGQQKILSRTLELERELQEIEEDSKSFYLKLELQKDLSEEKRRELVAAHDLEMSTRKGLVVSKAAADISKDNLSTQEKLVRLEIVRLNNQKELKDLQNSIDIATQKRQEVLLETEFVQGKLTKEKYFDQLRLLKVATQRLETSKELSDIDSGFEVYKEELKLRKDLTEEEKAQRLEKAKAEVDARKNLVTAKSNLQTAKDSLDFLLDQIDLRYTLLNQAKEELDIQKRIEDVSYTSGIEIEERALEIAKSKGQLSREELTTQTLLLGLKRNEVAFNTTLNNLAQQYVSEVLPKLQELERARVSGDKLRVEQLEAQLAELYKLLGVETERAKQEQSQADQVTRVENSRLLNTLLQSELQTRREIQDLQDTDRLNTIQTQLSLEETRLSALETLGALTASQLVREKALLQQRKLNSDFEQKNYRVITDSARQIQDIENRINAGNITDEQKTALQDQQQQIRLNLASTLNGLSAEQKFRLAILGITTEQAVADAKRVEHAKKLNEQYDAMTSTAKLLGDVFDGFGDRFAESIGGLSDVLRNDLEARNNLEKEYDEKRRKIEEKYKDDELNRLYFLRQAREENSEKSQLLDLKRDQEALKSFKGLFKEKTTAYKALGDLEKLMALQTLAINAKLLISNVATIASNVSAGVARMFGQGGFAGFAGAAAFLALMGSLGVFKGSAKNLSGPSLEDVQASQLTGQTYVGNTLTTRAGALEADPTAKLESIDQSIELLKNSSFDQLNFSNKSQKSLEKIEQNTRALAEQIAISLGGLTSNLPVGTRTTGPFGFGNSIIGSAASLATGALGGLGGFIGGTAAASYLGNLFVNTLGSAIAGSASALTNIITSALGPIGAVLGFVLGKNIDKVLNSVFGGKTTSTLKNVTLQLSGSLESLSTASDEFVKTFATLEMRRKGGWFRSDKIWDEIIPTETPDILKEYVGTLFMSIKDSVVQAGEVLGQDTTAALNTALSLPLDISLKDRKPEEIVEAIKNQVSVAFNEFAKAGFGSLIAALRDPLEEAGTTLTRLTTQVTLFDQAMKLMGKNVDDVTGTLKIVVADRLVELLGGVESFKDKTTFFVENFLSESEQIAPIAQELTKELNALGISADITREQYKALVLQQDLSTDSGQDTYAALLNLAEAFDKVTSAAEQSQEKLNGFLKSITDFIRSQSLQLVQPSQTTKTLFQEFGITVSKALAGDENSLSYLPDIASQTIESAKNSSASLREFNRLRAGILSSLSEVADKIESGDLKILTPQEQANEYLKQIEYNTANFSADLAREIDRQQEIKTIVNDPDLAAQAVAASFAEVIQESGNDATPLNPATLAFLDAEAKAQKEYDDRRASILNDEGIDIGPGGPRDTRMAAVGQLIGAGVGGFARLGEAIKTGDLSKLAPDLSLVTLENLGIKTPSLEAVVRDVSMAAQSAKAATTFTIASALNALKSVVDAVFPSAEPPAPPPGAPAVAPPPAPVVPSGGVRSLRPVNDSGSSGDSGMGFSADALSASFADPETRESLTPNALGGAFNKGIKMFATGGAFSNSVVNNPTMFPLGVMGEAGPEAIMPLTRMGDGSLGVTAEVPVNNRNNQTDAALLSEVKKLRQEIQGLRTEARVSAVGTNKTFRLLERVTRNGESMQVVDVTPV